MNYVPTDLPDDVQWGFTREGLIALPHHAHPIAHARGFAQRMMATYWPGLSWQQAMGLVSKTGVWEKRGNSFSGLEVADHVKELHLLFDGGHRIISFEGGESPPTSTRNNDPGGFLVQLPPEGLTSSSSMRDVARFLLERLRPR